MFKTFYNISTSLQSDFCQLLFFLRKNDGTCLTEINEELCTSFNFGCSEINIKLKSHTVSKINLS